MLGHAGRKAFQDSVLNILSNAGIYKARKEENKLPEGRKVRNTSEWVTRKPNGRNLTSENTIPAGRKPNQYDPMGKMIQRIRAVSIKNHTQLRKDESDEVFCSPKERTSNTQGPHRQSVIKTSSLQGHYNIPVSNSFSQFLN